MSDADPEQNEVRGERDEASVNRRSSMQSRVSNLLAIGLMSILGLGMLTWYYAHALTRQSRARQSAQTLSTNRAQGEMSLPSLGRIDPPPADPPSPMAPPNPTTLPEIPLDLSPATGPAGASGALQPKTAEQLALERQLSGAVFSTQGSIPNTAVGVTAPPPSAAGSQEPGDLAALLRPASSAAVRAQVLPTQRLLLPKGAFIDCTLETAIDSTWRPTLSASTAEWCFWSAARN
jgi:type IV secretion system protein VirB10